MSKIVVIGIKVDSSFVSSLRATLSLGRVKEKDKLTALEVLGLVALNEMMGAYPEQTYLQIPHEWRGNIDIAPEVRKVEEVIEKSTDTVQKGGE